MHKKFFRLREIVFFRISIDIFLLTLANWIFRTGIIIFYIQSNYFFGLSVRKKKLPKIMKIFKTVHDLVLIQIFGERVNQIFFGKI